MKRTLFLIFMFIILGISLFPLITMFFTAIIPQGNLTNVITEKYINDFEVKYINYIKRKIKTNAKISLVKDSPTSTQSLKIDIFNDEESVELLTSDMDLRVAKYISFYVKNVNNFVVEFNDIDENVFRYPIKLKDNNWQKVNINLKTIENIDLKHITKIGFVFSKNTSVYIDDIKIKYKFPTLMNFIIVWKENDFGRYMFNSLIIALAVVLGNIIFSTSVAYAFARREFFGKNVLFLIVLATMMIPPQITIIPIFIIMKNIGWINTYYSLIIPFLVTPFGIFLLKQYIEQLPIELEQAAYVDGANTFQILYYIIFPLSKPAIAVMSINTFITSWNDLFYPLVMTTSKDMRTVQVGLALFQKFNQVEWPILMAASSIIGIPVIIAFLIFQKHIISGITQGAVKG
ncbi:carbohydrate ABC transporter permease [Marinitoga sp. 38H-ov]|uniref:carbohydrate ABC transporter permease n=1 Tax=Marinitoga sp. 38H-ov TaxID=1755814 RepID=UPI0013EDAEBA|nr:carbohydrate ABC transporter permease [Marinitoga sp. 38H-ov]KAF2956133.1 ABC transporter permease [Marinitoga sp. 38H-ov]